MASHNIIGGCGDFSVNRQEGNIYVDKTEYIAKMLANSKYNVLCRPRRFGKSMLCSTLRTLFRHGLRDFSGLALEKTWDDSKTYKVLYLDFSTCGFYSGENLEKRWEHYLSFRLEDIDITFTDYSDEALIDGLRACGESSIVVIIDEYDNSLHHVMENVEAFQKAESLLSSFFHVLNESREAIHALFVTGTAKSKVLCPFEGITDISLDPRFAAILGYTEEEIKKYYMPYIEKIFSIHKNKMDKEEYDIEVGSAMQKLRDICGGYCFDSEGEISVFSPWIINNFFIHSGKYWENCLYGSGITTTLGHNMWEGHKIPDLTTIKQNRNIEISSLEDVDVKAVENLRTKDEISLLYHMGILSIKEWTNEDSVRLGFPNKPIKDTLKNLYRESIQIPGQFMVTNKDQIAKIENIFVKCDKGNHIPVISRIDYFNTNKNKAVIYTACYNNHDNDRNLFGEVYVLDIKEQKVSYTSTDNMDYCRCPREILIRLDAPETSWQFMWREACLCVEEMAAFVMRLINNNSIEQWNSVNVERKYKRIVKNHCLDRFTERVQREWFKQSSLWKIEYTDCEGFALPLASSYMSGLVNPNSVIISALALQMQKTDDPLLLKDMRNIFDNALLGNISWPIKFVDGSEFSLLQFSCKEFLEQYDIYV